VDIVVGAEIVEIEPTIETDFDGVGVEVTI